MSPDDTKDTVTGNMLRTFVKVGRLVFEMLPGLTDVETNTARNSRST